MTDIIITAQNPDHGDVNMIRFNLWTQGKSVLFRGNPLNEVAQGDRAYFQYHGAIWGFAYFDRYDHGSGYNLQGDHWESDHAMYLAPPMHRFDVSVDLRGATHCHGARYVDPTKYSSETIEQLCEQTRFAEARPGWFHPFCNYGAPDPDPFPAALMNVVRASIEEEDFRMGTEADVREFIQDVVLPNRRKAPTYETIAKRVDIDDWDEAIALTLCVLTSDEDKTWTYLPIVRNGGYVYMNGVQMLDLGLDAPTLPEDWIPILEEDGTLLLLDLFDCLGCNDGVIVDPKEGHGLPLVQLLRCPVSGACIAVTNDGYHFNIRPRPKKKAKPAKSKRAGQSKSAKKSAPPAKATKPKRAAGATAKAKTASSGSAKPKSGGFRIGKLKFPASNATGTKPKPKAAKPKPAARKAKPAARKTPKPKAPKRGK